MLDITSKSQTESFAPPYGVLNRTRERCQKTFSFLLLQASCSSYV